MKHKAFSLLIVEPFFTGSHKKWALELQENLSNFATEILSLDGKFWKWRMHGGAVELVRRFNRAGKYYDIILFSDMIDVCTFLSLADSSLYKSTSLYFHENQFAYPVSLDDSDRNNGRDYHYSFINYTSALAVDGVFFNSGYNKQSFLDGIHKMLKKMPDNQGFDTVDLIEEKSKVLNLGINLKKFEKNKDNISSVNNSKPVILWNHRHEYDKNPLLFFKGMHYLRKKGIDFELIICGNNSYSAKDIFEKATVDFKQELIFYGYCKTFEEYARLLYKADIIPVTSNQDFFGISVAEAMYCGVVPVLPKRLAFEDLYYTESTDRYFYENDCFCEKLTDIVKNIDSYKTDVFKDMVSLYDWSVIIDEYEKNFTNIVKNRKFILK